MGFLSKHDTGKNVHALFLAGWVIVIVPLQVSVKKKLSEIRLLIQNECRQTSHRRREN